MRSGAAAKAAVLHLRLRRQGGEGEGRRRRASHEAASCLKSNNPHLTKHASVLFADQQVTTFPSFFLEGACKSARPHGVPMRFSRTTDGIWELFRSRQGQARRFGPINVTASKQVRIIILNKACNILQPNHDQPLGPGNRIGQKMPKASLFSFGAPPLETGRPFSCQRAENRASSLAMSRARFMKPQIMFLMLLHIA